MMKRESSDYGSMPEQKKWQRLAPVICGALVLMLALVILAPSGPAGMLTTAQIDARFPVVTVVALSAGNTITDYHVYVAVNSSTQAEGYQNATSLGDCHGLTPCLGMLFYFQNQSDLCFWMKDTRIPLQQSWVNASGYVTYIYNATPYSTAPICAAGSMVIETLSNHTVQIGDRIIFIPHP
jgi:hypothetical protein